MNFSVIIPTFNRRHTLARALDSVLAQSVIQEGAKLQIIVVDDGSSDQTEELIEQGFPQVDYIYQENQGVSKARNTGLGAAQGEWILLLDSDDEWLPHKLRVQIDLLATTKLQVCHTEEIWWRHGVRVNQMRKHKKRGGWIFQHCLPLCAMSPSSILLHQDVIERVGLFDETLPACEDYDYWLRLTNQFEVAYVQRPCINKYGGHADQLSSQHWGMDRFRVQALENILNSPLKPEDRIAAQAVLEEKLQILLAGAKKRKNHQLLAQCTEKLSRIGGEKHVAQL